MAIAFRTASGADNAAGSTSVAVTKPTGTVSTDVLLASFVWDNSVSACTLTPPAGWTAIANPVTNGTMRSAAFWALGSVAALTFTYSNAHDNGWVVGAFTGVDNTTPIDATGTTSTSANSQTLVSNAVTAVTANALNVVAFGPYIGPAGTSASGWTVQPSVGSAVHQEADLCYKQITATGSTGTTTFSTTSSATGELLNAIPFVLRPAAGATFTPEPFLPVLGRQAVHRASSY